MYDCFRFSTTYSAVAQYPTACFVHNGYVLDANDEFYVNDNFQSKLTRIKVQLVTFKGESEPEKKETRTKVIFLNIFYGVHFVAVAV